MRVGRSWRYFGVNFFFALKSPFQKGALFLRFKASRYEKFIGHIVRMSLEHKRVGRNWYFNWKWRRQPRRGA